MFKKIVFVLVVFLALLGKNALAHELENHVVEMTHEGYSPRNITIIQGDAVEFKNIDSVPLWPASNIHPTHEIYSEFDPKEEIEPGESWKFTFDRAGVWKYHDHLYSNLSGTITVVEDEHAGKNIWERIKNFFAGLMGKLAGKKDSAKALLADIDPTITKDSTAIFSEDTALLSYIHKYGGDETIKRLSALQGQFGDCHQRAHKAGRLSYELVGEKAFEGHSSQCHSGYFHGAIEAFFKERGAENLSQDLKTICRFETNGFFSHQCFHGIGHGLMAWSAYELPEALGYCDVLPQMQASCYSGVFMENVVGGLAEGDEDESAGGDLHYTKYLNDDPHFPCNEISDKYEGACYYYQTSRMLQIFGSDFAKVAETCLEAPRQHQYLCFASMGRDVGGFHQNDVQAAIRDCQFAPYGEMRRECLTGAVQDRLWEPSGQESAVSFCRLLSDSAEKKACYNTIIYRAADILFDQNQRLNFCNLLEGGYRSDCSTVLQNTPAN